MWCVSFTSYEDDYRHRYDNGVYPEDNVLFRKEQDAIKYLNEKIYNEINDRFCEQDRNFMFDKFNSSKEYHKYISKVHIDHCKCDKMYCNCDEKQKINWKKCNNQNCKYFYYKIKKIYKNNSKVLELLYNKLTKGEYVENIFDYSLEYIEPK
jgi:hypothetical protein